MISVMTVLKWPGRALLGEGEGEGEGGAPRSLHSHHSSVKHHLFPSFKSSFITMVHTSHSLEPDLL